MSNKIFPKFEKHNDVHCVHCDEHIGKAEKPLFYGFPRGAYGMWCNICKLRSYYDTEDVSIKFDAKGDPLCIRP
jgi:hypothetical protein